MDAISQLFGPRVEGVPLVPRDDNPLTNIFLHLHSRSALREARLVNKRWAAISSLEEVLEANPERKRVQLATETWQYLFSFLHIRELAACSQLTKTAKHLTDPIWINKAVSLGYTGDTKNLPEAKEYLKRLLTVLTLLNQCNLLPDLNSELFELKLWSRDCIFKILNSEQARSIPDLCLLIRGYYLQARDSLRLSKPIPKSRFEKDVPWTMTAMEILQNSEDVNATDLHGHLPLQFAIEKGQKENALAFWCFSDSKHGYTPLHTAVLVDNRVAAEFFLDYFPIDCTTQKGSTPLHLAAAMGNLPMTQFLLERGADPHLLTKQKASPLLRVLGTGLAKKNSSKHALVAMLLLPHSQVNQANRYLCTALHYSAKCGMLEIVQGLLDHHADTNCRTIYDQLPLHLAVMFRNGHNKEIVEILLKANPKSVNAQDSHGNTPLHHATLTGLQDCVEILLHYGADTNLPNKDGELPLHLAQRIDHHKIANKLLPISNFHHANNQGWTSAHIAGDMGQPMIAEWLVDHGADLNAVTDDNELPLTLAINQKHASTAKKFFSKTRLSKHPGWQFSAMLLKDLVTRKDKKGSKRSQGK